MPVDLGGWSLPAWSALQKWQDTLLRGMLILSFLPCVNTSLGMGLIKGTLFPGQSEGAVGGEGWRGQMLGRAGQMDHLVSCAWWRQRPLTRLFPIIFRTFAYTLCWDLQLFTIWQLIKERQMSLVVKRAGLESDSWFYIPLRMFPSFHVHRIE